MSNNDNGKKKRLLADTPFCSALCGNRAAGYLQVTNNTTCLPMCAKCPELVDPEGKYQFILFYSDR